MKASVEVRVNGFEGLLHSSVGSKAVKQDALDKQERCS
jgi:hypothetical protein